MENMVLEGHFGFFVLHRMAEKKLEKARRSTQLEKVVVN